MAAMGATQRKQIATRWIGIAGLVCVLPALGWRLYIASQKYSPGQIIDNQLQFFFMGLGVGVLLMLLREGQPS